MKQILLIFSLVCCSMLYGQEQNKNYFGDVNYDGVINITDVVLLRETLNQGELGDPIVVENGKIIPEPATLAEGINLISSNITLAQGESKKLVASTIPAEASIRNVRWQSADPEIATVTDRGLVYGIKTGETTINAYNKKDNSLMASCTLTVNDLFIVYYGHHYYTGTMDISLGVESQAGRITANNVLNYIYVRPTIDRGSVCLREYRSSQNFRIDRPRPSLEEPFPSLYILVPEAVCLPDGGRRVDIRYHWIHSTYSDSYEAPGIVRRFNTKY